MTQTHLDKLKAISIAHPVPADIKLERRLKSLEKMRTFYQARVGIVSERQGWVFKEFVIAITYATTIIKMYRKLTKKLAELDDESNRKDDI